MSDDVERTRVALLGAHVCADGFTRDGTEVSCRLCKPDAPAGDAPETTNPAPISSRLGVDALAAARTDAHDHFALYRDPRGRAIISALIAAARAEGAAEEREACAKLAETFSTFTGANYCDEKSPEYDPKRHPVHDYGRGGNYVRRGIADAIRARSPSSGTEAP